MPARFPEEWNNLYTVINSWLFENDVSTLLNTTGNSGELLTILLDESTDESAEQVICLDDSPDPGITFQDSSINDADSKIERKTVSEYLQAIKSSSDKQPPDSSVSATDSPLADVVCTFDLTERREYSDESVDSLLSELGDQTGRPEDERILTANLGLREGGRGIFIVPKNRLRAYHSVFQYFDRMRIHAILDLDPERFGFEEIDHRFQFNILLVENKPLETDDGSVRYIELSEFDEQLGTLIHCPLAHTSNVNIDEKPLELRVIDQRDFLELPPHIAYNIPDYLPLFRSDELINIGEIDEISVYRELHPTAPETFYFTKGEMEKSSINFELFTPLLHRETVREIDHSIGEMDLDYYLLDLREPINDIEDQYENPDTNKVVSELRKRGYSDAVDYLSEHVSLNSKSSLCPVLNQSKRTPDFVFPELAPDGRWNRVDLDTAVVDRMCYGVDCSDHKTTEVLHRILQTNGYQKLIEGLFDSKFGGTIHYMKYLIDQIPLPCRALTTDFIDKSDSVYPPQTRRDEVEFTNILTDCINENNVREIFKELFKPNDEFAWAWFLSPEEYLEFKQLWESETETAKEFVAERLDEEEIEKIRRDLKGKSVPQQRSEIVIELLEEYQNQKHRLFIYGITPQFEGALLDWAKRQGHEPDEDEEGNYVVSIGGDGRSTIKKTLADLLDYYLRDGFGEFLHQNIRERRNEVAHGEVVPNDRNQATMFLLCFYALYRRTLLNT